MQPQKPHDQPIPTEPPVPLPVPEIQPVQVPSPKAMELRVVHNDKAVILLIDNYPYSFDPDTALSIALAIRNAANKIKAYQFTSKKGKHKK